jgi:hypothetical protein
VLRQEDGTQNDEQDGIPIISNKTIMLEARIRRLKICSDRSLRRYDDSSQAEPKVEDISLRTVMEAISLLRDSTEEKQAMGSLRRLKARGRLNILLFKSSTKTMNSIQTRLILQGENPMNRNHLLALHFLRKVIRMLSAKWMNLVRR